VTGLAALPPEWRIAIVAAVCAAAALLAIWRERRGRQAMARWRGGPPRDAVRRVARGAAIVAGAGLAAATVLADPPMPAAGDPRDVADAVVVALDISRSMDAADVGASRLEAARAFVAAVTARSAPGAIGLVLFAGEPALVCPLTGDPQAFQMALTEVPATQTATPGGSAIGAALERAARAFGSRRWRKTILLLSDGEATTADTAAALSALRAGGVTVHAVGIGTRAGVEMPLHRPASGETDGSTRVTRLEPEVLRAVAAGTGGLYVEGTGEHAVRQIAGRLQAPDGVEADEGGGLATWLLCASAACLLLERWMAGVWAGGRRR
jgi:Ca-activated chloride channel family protein